MGTVVEEDAETETEKGGRESEGTDTGGAEGGGERESPGQEERKCYRGSAWILTGLKKGGSCPEFTPQVWGRLEIHRTESRVFMGPRMVGAPLSSGVSQDKFIPLTCPQEAPQISPHPTPPSPRLNFLATTLHTANPQLHSHLTQPHANTPACLQPPENLVEFLRETYSQNKMIVYAGA